MFSAHVELDGLSRTFDDVLSEIGFVKALEKDESGTVVTHLGFQIDSNLMEVRLPPNKHARVVRAVSELASRKHVPQASFEETLGFLSHCCQVIPLGRPFLRQLFSLLKRKSRSGLFSLQESWCASMKICWIWKDTGIVSRPGVGAPAP